MLIDLRGDDSLFNDFPPLWIPSTSRIGSEQQTLHQSNTLSLQTSMSYASIVSGRAPSGPLGGTAPRLTLPSDIYQGSQVEANPSSGVTTPNSYDWMLPLLQTDEDGHADSPIQSEIPSRLMDSIIHVSPATTTAESNSCPITTEEAATLTDSIYDSTVGSSQISNPSVVSADPIEASISDITTSSARANTPSAETAPMTSTAIRTVITTASSVLQTSTTASPTSTSIAQLSIPSSAKASSSPDSGDDPTDLFVFNGQEFVLEDDRKLKRPTTITCYDISEEEPGDQAKTCVQKSHSAIRSGYQNQCAVQHQANNAAMHHPSAVGQKRNSANLTSRQQATTPSALSGYSSQSQLREFNNNPVGYRGAVRHRPAVTARHLSQSGHPYHYQRPARGPRGEWH